MENLSVYSDEELIAKFHDASGRDEEKNQIMTYLLEKYKPLVSKISNAFFLIGGDQSDLIQEGMIAMYQAVVQFDGEKNTKFSTFANMCIRRELIDVTKKATTEKNRMLNEAVSLTQESDADGVPMAENIEDLDAEIPETVFFEQAERELFLRRLEARLSKLERQVLMLYLKGLSYTEIAKILDKTPKSVDNAFQRIRQKCADVKAEE